MQREIEAARAEQLGEAALLEAEEEEEAQGEELGSAGPVLGSPASSSAPPLLVVQLSPEAAELCAQQQREQEGLALPGLAGMGEEALAEAEGWGPPTLLPVDCRAAEEAGLPAAGGAGAAASAAGRRAQQGGAEPEEEPAVQAASS